MQFTTKQLRSLAFNGDAFNQGVDYFLDGFVDALACHYDQCATTLTPPIILTGTVRPEDTDLTYHTTIHLYKEKVSRMHCTCDNFEKTANACPHVLATLLQFSDEAEELLATLPSLEKEDLAPSPVTTHVSFSLDNHFIVTSLYWQYPTCRIDCVTQEVIGSLEGIVRNKEAESVLKQLIGKYHFKLYRDNLLYLTTNDEVFKFVNEGLQTFMDLFETTVTPEIQQLNVKKFTAPKLELQLINNEIFFNWNDHPINLHELYHIFTAYSDHSTYHRLENGDFLVLEKLEEADQAAIQEFLELLKPLVGTTKMKGKSQSLALHRALFLDKVFKNSHAITISYNDAFEHILRDLYHSTTHDYPIPNALSGTLRDYQLTGFKWLKTLAHYNLGGILADDMGLGKTIQAICLLLSDVDERTQPSLVICPTSLVLNWQQELERFAPSLKVVIVTGGAQRRLALLDDLSHYDVVLTSYDLLSKDIMAYERHEFHYCIADEAHYIKNKKTLKSMALRSLRSKVRFALTGTPIENRLSELWTLFDFIMPGYLFTYPLFKHTFEDPITKDGVSSSAQSLSKLIAPFILRRLKSDVLSELPDKIESVCYVPMAQEQEDVYKLYLEAAFNDFNQEIQTAGFNRSQIKVLSLLTRLRQLCCHPKLFLEQYTGESGKLDSCMELISTSIDSGHKVLIFSQFTSMLEIIAKELNTSGIAHYLLRGSTPSNKRLDMVNAFNEDDTPVFLISLKAGGVGLNLTSADVVIHYDPWWNVSAQNQATDRAHRIGQVNQVQVYKLITKNSIEEKIQQLQQRKLDLTEQVLDQGEMLLSQLSEEDIFELFR